MKTSIIAKQSAESGDKSTATTGWMLRYGKDVSTSEWLPANVGGHPVKYEATCRAAVLARKYLLQPVPYSILSSPIETTR